MFCSGQSKEVAALFSDYKKAFDSVPHQSLIRNFEGVDLNPVILAWVKDYLADHSQYVVVNGASSQPLQLFLAFLKALFWVLCYSLCT